MQAVATSSSLHTCQFPYGCERAHLGRNPVGFAVSTPRLNLFHVNMFTHGPTLHGDHVGYAELKDFRASVGQSTWSGFRVAVCFVGICVVCGREAAGQETETHHGP